MEEAKKITLNISEKLLKDAQEQTGEGITETVRRGLILLASSKAYNDLRSLKGRVAFSRTYKELKEDRI